MRRSGVLLALVAACATPPLVVREATLQQRLVARAPLAVIEGSGAVYIVEPEAIAIARGGAIAERVAAPAGTPWTAAAEIAALDGEGRWIVAVAGGRLWRISAGGDREDVTDRLHLDAAVRAVGGAGRTLAIGLANGAALSADGHHLARTHGAEVARLAVAGERVATWDPNALAVLDLAHRTEQHYALDGISDVAVLDAAGPHPRFAAARGRAIYVERDGVLERRGFPAPVQRIAAAGTRLWVLAGSTLYALDPAGASRVTVDTGGAPMFGAASGDVWLARDGALTAYALGRTTEDPRWLAEVQPVFARVCSKCHLPGGSADVDLSTAGAWHTEHDELVDRVITTRTMPPEGTELSDADRAALVRYLGRL